MLNFFGKQNLKHKISHFYSSYGFSAGAEKNPYKKGQLIQKVICSEENAEIYQIGNISGDSWPNGKIFVLVWGTKTIPFILTNPLQITERPFEKYREVFKQEKLVARYTVPVSSVLVIDIGKDLKKLPRGRDHSAHYDHYCFSDKEKHSYAFIDFEEYNEACSLIKSGLVTLLYDQYDHKRYCPIIPAEILIGVGPWNLHENLYQKEKEDQNIHFGSVYRRVNSISLRLNLALSIKNREDEELISTIRMGEKWSELKAASDYQVSMQDKSNETVNEWMKEFKRKVKSVEAFIDFMETHPAKRPAVGTFRLGDIMQDDKNRNELYAHIAESNPAILEKFYQYKINLEQDAISGSKKYFSISETEIFEHKTFNDFVAKTFNDTAPTLTIEEIMKALISAEVPYFYSNKYTCGSSFNTNILKSPVFIECVKKSYSKHYTSICSSYELMLVSITEIMTRRVAYRISLEQQKNNVEDINRSYFP